MTAPRIYQAHDPSFGDDGTDVLVTVWPDVMTVALREGHDWTELTWGPPVTLTDASVLRLVRGDDGGRR